MLYSLLGDILDCDYRRLIDAFDDVDGDLLHESIIAARENKNLNLHGIMSEVIDLSFNKCCSLFYKEIELKIDNLDENSGEIDMLERFDIDKLRDCIQFEDSIYYTNNVYSNDEMKKYTTLLADSFKKLTMLIGYIEGLPIE